MHITHAAHYLSYLGRNNLLYGNIYLSEEYTQYLIYFTHVDFVGLMVIKVTTALGVTLECVGYYKCVKSLIPKAMRPSVTANVIIRNISYS
ncbi:MAG: hypothetical protein ACI9UT_002762 [Flavobacteriales bacterium]